MFKKILPSKLGLITKVLGWIQIAGGIFGLGLIAYLLMETGSVTGVILLFFLLGLSLFIFSIYAGKKLLFSESRNEGLILSIINQLLQIVQFKVLGFGFSYSTFITIAAGVKGTSLSLRAEAALAAFQMSINSSNDEYFITVNFVAIIIITLLLSIFKATKMPKNKGNQGVTLDCIAMEE